MNFTIGTAQMNVILSKVAKGVGNNKIMPITEYIEIILTEGDLIVSSTDTANFITYRQQDVKGEDGVVIVKADQLIKLVARTTKANMTFTEKDDHLEVKGNGTYKVPILTGEDYPTYEFDGSAPSVTVKTQELKKMFSVNKSAIATDMLMPCLTGYNLGGSHCVTTNGVKMCINDSVHMFEGQSMLVPPVLAELISTLSDETVEVQKEGNKLLFTTEHITVFGAELDGIEEYPDVTGVLGIEYDNTAKVNKAEIINTLDRLKLFADPFDNNAVRLLFTETGLVIEDLKQNSQETLDYSESAMEEVDIECIVNVGFLQDLLEAIPSDCVNFAFAGGMPLKIYDKAIAQIISVMTPQVEESEDGAE